MNGEQKIPKKFTKIIAPFSTLALSSSYCDSKVPRAHKVYRPEVDLYGRVADDGAVSGAGRVCPAAVVGRFIVTVQVLV